MSKSVFKFKNFNVTQTDDLHKVGTDAMVLGALVDYDSPKAILDVGTGCGVLALMLAQSFPKSTIIGIDIDDNAISQANENFKNTSFLNDFTAETIDFINYKSSTQFDIIVSNPPYFNSRMPSNVQQRNLARHENSMTLKKLINHAAELLSEDGELWIIVPKERTEELKEQLNCILSHSISIFGKPNRHVRDVLVYSSKKKSKTLPNSLTIRNNEGGYTEEYKNLTELYHFNQL